ncbi:MAG TPA: serine hydrolase domain-containing protein [Candidatus Paceibacterota bacterium]|nr:serine hydrolase domain-containing protein [Candidatus Paceibacterota bacterium]
MKRSQPESLPAWTWRAKGWGWRQSLLWLLAVAPGLLGASLGRAFDSTECQAVLERGVKERAFPGCTAVVGTEAGGLWSGAIGHHDYTNGVPVRPDTIYDLASVTKVAGTTAVFMRLVALGKVRLSDPVSRYVPAFAAGGATPEERARRERVTVEHLLTHSSGLPSWKPFYRSVNSYPALLEAVCQTPLESAPGERVRYSDCGMMLAGEVAARAGGKPLKALERELVFEPLGMTHTLRCPDASLANRIPPTEVEAGTGQAVHGIVHDENARAGGGETGHAGLFATAEDLGKLARELLRACQGRSGLFPREVVNEFFRPRQIGRATRAVGWNLMEEKPGRMMNHNGFTGTYLELDLDRNRFVVLLTNRVHPSRDNNSVSRVRREFLAAVERQFDPPAGRQAAERSDR